ncbi:hypothetical protein HXX76_009285 [Chlamydomonas incerta]|uniref:Uncharacterized protein n=1 Tax=Chlamydomonas incerta TaxID=51695 RepID=A0A835T3H9_CHLIN|nr:hypothetical protein HXX76_009285 [Chlamydomonas incerta]|eukprot:KAG2431790.1 hypothetical protein HXX76_009285 [Chlamydomonas incerta]
MWLRFFCLTCGINEAPPQEVHDKADSGTSSSPGAATSCPALETGGTEAPLAAAPAAAPTPTPPYVRRHQRTITLDGSEGSFISVGLPADGNEWDRSRSDGGAGSPLHPSALAGPPAAATAAAGAGRMARHSYSPAMPGPAHRRGVNTTGGGAGNCSSSPPLWARRPCSAKALAYSGGGTASHTPAVPSRFSLNGGVPVSHSAYSGTGGGAAAAATAADCSSISASAYGGVSYGGYGSRTMGGANTAADACCPSQPLQRPSGGRLHRHYYAPPAAAGGAAAGAAATAGSAAAAPATVAHLAARSASDDALPGDDAAAVAALQRAAQAAASRHVAAQAAAAIAKAQAAAAASSAAVVAAEAGGDTANEADKEDNSSIDSAATVVLVEAETTAAAAGDEDVPRELGPSPFTSPWGPNVWQRTLLPAHPQQQLLLHSQLPPPGPRSPGGASEASAATSARPWRSCYEPACAPASGVQPLAGLRLERASGAPPAAPPAVATVYCCKEEHAQDAGVQLPCLKEPQYPPPPFAPSSSKLLLREACPPRRTVTGSSFGSCNNSISLRVDLSGNGGFGALAGDSDAVGGGGGDGAEGRACSASPGVVFATRVEAVAVA